MRVLKISACLLFLLALSLAQETPPDLPQGGYAINLIIKDAATLEPLSGKIINMLLSGPGAQIRTVQLLDSRSSAKLSLDKGSWRIIAEINDQSTAGNDYFAAQNFEVENDANLSLLMMPVGSLSGAVYENNQSVANAKIMLRCVSSFYDMGEFYANVKTDEFGSFAVRNVPAESCEVFASGSGRIGSTKLSLRRGELRSIEIHLAANTAKPSEEFSWLNFLFIIAAILLVTMVLYSKYFRRHGKVKGMQVLEKAAEKPEKPVREHREIRVTEKMQGILQTLSENERKILEYLIQNGGKGRQNKIYYALLIPKVSLSRAVYSLESKNIIKTKRFGKVKELELTEWFLN